MVSRSLGFLALLVSCGVDDGVASDKADLRATAGECGTDDIAPDEVVATWNGGRITYGDLEAEVGGELRSMELQYLLNRYESRSQALEELVVRKLLEEEAARRRIGSVDALLAEEIERKVAKPTAPEVEAFYPLVQRQLRGASLEEARPFLEQELLQRAQAEAYREFVGALQENAGVERRLPYPDLPRVEVPIEEHDPVRGPADAPVTLVQFAEYQCYFCNKVNSTLDRLFEEYDGKIRLVFKDFPLSGHGRAVPAAVAAHCAGEQGRYWEMNATLLGNQQALGDADFLRYAKEHALDVIAFESCLDSNRYEPTIQQDMAQAREAGVQATPTIYVNGVVIAGAQPYERFKDLVERELAR